MSGSQPLPTGVVTFLLTDIEGSTKAWQARPGQMTALVSRHYEILESGVRARGGVHPQEQGEGDSVVAVFVDPVAAVTAAIETQLALRAELSDLPVRMALHTGEAMLRNEDNYVGLTIIRCARIRSCGYGGQILLSDETARHVDGDLPGGCRVVDLGLYGLRGLEGRDRIWQLAHPDLPADFPRLKAGTSAAGNLPQPLTTFVGRDAELDALGEALRTNRLITLTGDAGIGKSRVANAAADAAANAMPGGVWWVSIADAGEDDRLAVSASIMRACSLARAGDDPLDTIVDHFRSVAAALLVVDGIETAPESAALVIGRLLEHCPDLRVIATGRDPLHLAGESIRDLGPLGLPPMLGGANDADTPTSAAALDRFDATRLFVERAAAASSLDVADADVAHIVHICSELHGVPLAIELAAAHTRMTPIAELASSLVELDIVGPDASARSGALASSIAWTYQFIGREAQMALRRLGVFRGDAKLDAATAVVVDASLTEAAAAGAIRRLLDQRLVTLDDSTGRLGMSEPIREFARDRLADSAEHAGAVERHGAWFAASAERFATPSDLPLSLLAPDQADVVEALDASMRGREPAVAYRILVAVGVELRGLGQGDVADRAATWITTRSPSDGEELWASVVARLCLDQADRPEAAVHAFADEARAIAELAGDTLSPALLDRAAGTVHEDMAVSP
ncbi:MAG: AAA family ATPase [Ilumatobacteraceae bacterium]